MSPLSNLPEHRDNRSCNRYTKKSSHSGRRCVPLATCLLILFCATTLQADSRTDCFYNLVVSAEGQAELQNLGQTLEVSNLTAAPADGNGFLIDLSNSLGKWYGSIGPVDMIDSLPPGSALAMSIVGTIDDIPNSTLGSCRLVKDAEDAWYFEVSSAATYYRLQAYDQGRLIFDAYYPVAKANWWQAIKDFLGVGDVEIDLDVVKWTRGADGSGSFELISLHVKRTAVATTADDQTIEFDELVISAGGLPPGNAVAEKLDFATSDIDRVIWMSQTGARINNSAFVYEADLAQDAFPAIGVLDYANLGANSCRFDAARNISPAEDLLNDAGDSISFRAPPYREGAVLNGKPWLRYKLRPNPLFDPYRTSGLPNEGSVACDSTFNGTGDLLADRWHCDLPDTGFFFPGDVLHYFLEMEDNLAGDVITYTLPQDTTGYSSFSWQDYVQYSRAFTVRALPTMMSALPGDQPEILLWDDAGTADDETRWRFALQNLGYVAEVDYDIYYTNDPMRGCGNGLGGRSSSLQLDAYRTILYTSGDLNVATISNGDFEYDPGNDAGVLDTWLAGGNRNLLLAGNNLAYDLAQSGAVTQAFMTNWMGVAFVARDLAQLTYQIAPWVGAVAGNPVFHSIPQWQVFGCDVCSQMPDAVTVAGSAVRLAEYTNEGGDPGLYPYAAGTLYVDTTGSRVISLPYDLKNILSDGSGPAAIPSRASILQDILVYFGHLPWTAPTSVPDQPAVVIRAYPNPFNPTIRIEYRHTLMKQMKMDIYNIRGQHVANLYNGLVGVDGGYVSWDGTNDSGRTVSSGTYFVKTWVGDTVDTQKVTLVR